MLTKQEFKNIRKELYEISNKRGEHLSQKGMLQIVLNVLRDNYTFSEPESYYVCGGRGAGRSYDQKTFIDELSECAAEGHREVTGKIAEMSYIEIEQEENGECKYSNKDMMQRIMNLEQEIKNMKRILCKDAHQENVLQAAR